MSQIFMRIFLCICSVYTSFNLYALDPSTAETDFHNESKVFDYHNILSFYQPNYILLFAHNKNPDYAIYRNRTPGKSKINHNEAKVQFSLYVPILRSMFGIDDLRFYFAYTQLFFWQIYNSQTPFIREVNYEPIFWLRYHFAENMFANLQFDHQSNGKGGYYEVSWNRIIGSAEFTSEHWYTQFSVWYPFWPLKADGHNAKSLMHYLGYDKIVLSYNWKDIVISFEAQNLESGLKRGHMMGSVSYAANSYIKLYMQYFSGYGQTLIEFDHYTTTYGFGIALSDWQ